MKKLAVGMLAVCLLPIVAAAQLTGNPHDKEGMQTSFSQAERDSLADQVLQEAIAQEFEQIAKKYPAQADDVRHVARLHSELVGVFRHGLKDSFGSHFYQHVLIKMEDLSAAVLDIQEETVRYACLDVLDHRYVFTPINKKTSSLKDIADHVADKIGLYSGGFAQPKWGNFYETLSGYSK